MSVCRWADIISSDSGYSFGRIAGLERDKLQQKNDDSIFDPNISEITEVRSINAHVSKLNLKKSPTRCSFKGILSELSNSGSSTPASSAANINNNSSVLPHTENKVKQVTFENKWKKNQHNLTHFTDIYLSDSTNEPLNPKKKRKDQAPRTAPDANEKPKEEDKPVSTKLGPAKPQTDAEKKPETNGKIPKQTLSPEMSQLVSMLISGDFTGLSKLPTESIQSLAKSLNSGDMDNLNQSEKSKLLEQVKHMQQILIERIAKQTQNGITIPNSTANGVSEERRVSSRLKDIAVGKATKEYQNYISRVPRHKRAEDDPQTPDPMERCSAAKFHAKYRVWRVGLHKYDK